MLLMLLMLLLLFSSFGSVVCSVLFDMRVSPPLWFFFFFFTESDDTETAVVLLVFSFRLLCLSAQLCNHFHFLCSTSAPLHSSWNWIIIDAWIFPLIARSVVRLLVRSDVPRGVPRVFLGGKSSAQSNALFLYLLLLLVKYPKRDLTKREGGRERWDNPRG
ncbi:hypothetical protein FRC18_005576 [Serendipita sp. 400]|nr:hypothetical protein FRC18_005576 [Serendipita sp. 400]